MSVRDSIQINFSNILSVVVVILGALVLYAIINPVFNTTVKTLTKVVYISEKEGMKNKKKKKDNNKKKTTKKGGKIYKSIGKKRNVIGSAGTGTTSFCDTYKNDLNSLEKKCNGFTKSTCQATSCCVWLNGTKCVAGDVNGPTFQTDNSGKKINIDYYFYTNKCKGKNCPK